MFQILFCKLCVGNQLWRMVRTQSTIEILSKSSVVAFFLYNAYANLWINMKISIPQKRNEVESCDAYYCVILWKPKMQLDNGVALYSLLRTHNTRRVCVSAQLLWREYYECQHGTRWLFCISGWYTSDMCYDVAERAMNKKMTSRNCDHVTSYDVSYGEVLR